MILLKQQPEIQPYLPQPIPLTWVKTRVGNTEEYYLEVMDEASTIGMNAGWRNRGLVHTTGFAHATLALLESGAVLASFPLLGKMPGTIQADPFTVWFVLDAPARVPAGIFGKEIDIAAGRHLMTQSFSSWVVFFKPVNKTKLLQRL